MRDDKPTVTYIQDGLLNLMSNLGVSDRDKNAASVWKRNRLALTRETLDTMYTENWLAQKIVTVIPKDMVREWRTISIGKKDDAVKEYEKEERRLKLRLKVREAMTWARLYGGAAIIPIIDGEDELDTELNPTTISKGSLKRLVVVDSWSLNPTGHIQFDPFEPNYLNPEFYHLAGSKARIHNSRIIKFEGHALPRFEKQIHRYWGQSVLEPVRVAITEAFTSTSSTASLMHEHNVDVISVKDLAAKFAAGMEEEVKKRFETYGFMKSIMNMVVLDADEQFMNRQLSLSGFEKVMEFMYDIVAGATEIPVTKLYGTSPAGMNATGEHDEKNYYDMIASQQEDILADRLDTLDTLIATSLWGGKPEDFESEFNPLWQESDADVAAREKVQAEVAASYLQMGVITEDVVAQDLMERGVYSRVDEEYVTKVEQAVKEAEEQAEEQADAILAGIKAPEGQGQMNVEQAETAGEAVPDAKNKSNAPEA